MMGLKISYVKDGYWLLHRLGVYYLFRAPIAVTPSQLTRAWENYVKLGKTLHADIQCVAVSRNHDDLLKLVYSKP